MERRYEFAVRNYANCKKYEKNMWQELRKKICGKIAVIAKNTKGWYCQVIRDKIADMKQNDVSLCNEKYYDKENTNFVFIYFF